MECTETINFVILFSQLTEGDLFCVKHWERVILFQCLKKDTLSDVNKLGGSKNEERGNMSSGLKISQEAQVNIRIKFTTRAHTVLQIVLLTTRIDW